MSLRGGTFATAGFRVMRFDRDAPGVDPSSSSSSSSSLSSSSSSSSDSSSDSSSSSVSSSSSSSDSSSDSTAFGLPSSVGTGVLSRRNEQVTVQVYSIVIYLGHHLSYDPLPLLQPS